MLLEAITVCINYADYLQVCIDNRVHFDVWHIVTVPSDTGTRALCSAYSLECHLVDFYGPQGEGFNPVNNKAPAINYALEHVAPEAWALLIDADILLPKTFRSIVNRSRLNKARLYGVQGRRIVVSPELLDSLRHRAIHHTELDAPTSILGYFQLFSNAGPHNRYLAVPPQTTMVDHDDLRFTNLYHPGLQALLPVTVIHLGNAYRNWQGRSTPQFQPLELSGEITAPLPPFLAQQAQVVVDYGCPSFSMPSSAILLDISPLAFHESPTTFAKQLATVRDCGPIGFYIACDISSALLESLLSLLEVLSISPAWMAGSGFAGKSSAQSMLAILINLGPPDEVWSTGMWRKYAPKPSSRLLDQRIVLYVPTAERLQEAFLCAALITTYGFQCVLTGRSTESQYAEWLAYLSGCSVGSLANDPYTTDLPEWATFSLHDSPLQQLNLCLDYCDYFPSLLPFLHNRHCLISTHSGEPIAYTGHATTPGLELRTHKLQPSPKIAARRSWAKAASLLRTPVYMPQGTLLQFEGPNSEILGLLRSVRFEGAALLASGVSHRLLQIVSELDLATLVPVNSDLTEYGFVARIRPSFRVKQAVWLRSYIDYAFPLRVLTDDGTSTIVEICISPYLPRRSQNSDDLATTILAAELGIVNATGDDVTLS